MCSVMSNVSFLLPPFKIPFDRVARNDGLWWGHAFRASNVGGGFPALRASTNASPWTHIFVVMRIQFILESIIAIQDLSWAENQAIELIVRRLMLKTGGEPTCQVSEIPTCSLASWLLVLQLQACKPKSSIFSLFYKITEVTTIQARSGFPQWFNLMLRWEFRDSNHPHHTWLGLNYTKNSAKENLEVNSTRF